MALSKTRALDIDSAGRLGYSYCTYNRTAGLSFLGGFLIFSIGDAAADVLGLVGTGFSLAGEPIAVSRGVGQCP